MKYLSIDIETTGLDYEKCEILSIGVVVEDTNNIRPIEELPQIHVAVLRENIYGSIFAIDLNKELIRNINRYKEEKDILKKENISKETNTIYLEENDVVPVLLDFVRMYYVDEASHNEKLIYLNVAGKNFGTFDKMFLDRFPKWKQYFRTRHRIIDPGILYTDWKNDESIPALDLCKERAGFDSIVTHNALEDAIDVVKILRKFYIN